MSDETMSNSMSQDSLDAPVTIKEIRAIGVPASIIPHEIYDEKASLVSYRCYQHPTQPVQFYCPECEVDPFCAYCLVNQLHLGHEITEIYTGWKDIKAQWLETKLRCLLESLVKESYQLEKDLHGTREERITEIIDEKGVLDMKLKGSLNKLEVAETAMVDAIKRMMESAETESDKYLNKLETIFEGLAEMNNEIIQNDDNPLPVGKIMFYHKVLDPLLLRLDALFDENEDMALMTEAAAINHKVKFFTETTITHLSVLGELASLITDITIGDHMLQ